MSSVRLDEVEEQPAVNATAIPASATTCRGFRFFIRSTLDCESQSLNESPPWFAAQTHSASRGRRLPPRDTFFGGAVGESFPQWMFSGRRARRLKPPAEVRLAF